MNDYLIANHIVDMDWVTAVLGALREGRQRCIDGLPWFKCLDSPSHGTFRTWRLLDDCGRWLYGAPGKPENEYSHETRFDMAIAIMLAIYGRKLMAHKSSEATGIPVSTGTEAEIQAEGEKGA